MFKGIFASVLAAAGLLLVGSPTYAQTGISQKVAVCNPSYPSRCVAVAADGSIPTTGGGGGGGNTSVTATAAAPSYVEGSTTNPLSTNLTGDLRTISKQNGTWTVGLSAGTNNIGDVDVLSLPALPAGANTIGTVNLGTIGGAATAALQGAQGTGGTYNPPTGGSGEIGYLSGIYAAAIDTTPVAVTGSGTAGSPAAGVVSVQGITSGTAITVTGTTGVAQGSTTSGQLGPLTQCAVTTAAPTYTTAQTSPLSCDTGGLLRVSGGGGGVVTQATAANLNAQVVGDVALGAANSGNPVQVGGIAFSGVPTAVATGTRRTFNTDLSGNMTARLVAALSTTTDGAADGVTGLVLGNNNFGNSGGLAVRTFSFNGTSWDRIRTIADATGVPAGTGVTAVAQAPTSAAAQAIVPVVSAAVESSHVIKASAGNLFRIGVTSGASAGYLMVFNATSAPADGVVTPIFCKPVAANAGAEWSWTIPARYSTGITAAFSTTGCFLKTASATAFIEGYAQ